MIEFRGIANRDELWAVIDLEVASGQENLVSPNVKTMAEAPFEPGALVRAMWQGTEPVGLMAMINPSANPPDHDRELRRDTAYLWRLMIGGAFQGKGIGTMAMNEAKRTAMEWGCRAINLSVANEPHAAIPFYERFGFVLTGRRLWDDSDEVEMLCQFSD